MVGGGSGSGGGGLFQGRSSFSASRLAAPRSPSPHNVDPNITAPYDEGPRYAPYVSDPTHPDYDPRIDPALQLRTVRTAAASIAESHASDARREAKRKSERRRMGRSNTILNKLGRGKTLLRKDGSRPGALGALIQEELRVTGHGLAGAGAHGTGGVGVGVPFDSAQQDKTPAAPVAGLDEDAEEEAKAEKKQTQTTGSRRSIYLNLPLPSSEVNRSGEPRTAYPRNRVRTSKYNVVTFLPRFLWEQFHRLANVYFLGLVIMQVPSIFGATLPQIAMLPLVAILALTAIKDGIEDHRRHILDNQVNNSAVTKLGGWRNVNQPKDARTWLQKLLGLSGRGDAKVSRGVKKLREKEDAIGMSAMRESKPRYQPGAAATRESLATTPEWGGMSTIASEGEHEDNASLAHSARDRIGAAAHIMSRNDSSKTATDFQQRGNDVDGAVGVVDYRRTTAGKARWERTLWKKLEVGDIVLLREDEQVPADIIVLNSSGEDGIVFVETKNLDGETNLKPRRSLKATRGIQSEEDIEASRFLIDVEPPHANLYSFTALLKYARGDGDAPPDSSAYASAEKHVEPVTINELLLRGCAIRNTEWVIGIVAFTGSDTKIMLNSGETPSKRSKIEKETNWNVLANFVLLILMCAVCAIFGGLAYDQKESSMKYYEPGALDSSSNIVNALIILGSCLVVFQNIVPISLYISIELVKTVQAFFIYQDADMYYEPLDHPCVPKTWNISDDLGQIEYIFSDKTGTLTQNVMEFKKCSINGVSYGEGVTEAQLGAMKRQGQDTSQYSPEAQKAQLDESKRAMIQTMTRSYKSRYLREDRLTLISQKLGQDLASGSPPDQRRAIIAFFRALALCHTALTDRPDGEDPFTLEYKAESPDEAALVAAARDVGAVFLNKTNQQVDIEVMGQPERYTPLKVLEFNSTRKRMSVIVREPEGRILMLTKGADSVIYQRLRQDHPQDLKVSTQRDLDEYANAGLRTLCIAYRYLEESEYLEWARTFDEASASTTDREDKIDDACETIEHDFTLLGATALEDKLQEGVPDAIAQLHEAGIKLWVLTGDKMQTAIEIGFSCNLLNADTEVMIISADHEAGTRSQIEAACNKIAAAGRPILVEKPARHGHKRRSTIGFEPTPEALAAAGPSGKTSYAVVIDGETLRYALDPVLKPLFLALTTQCETVVCCRVSPAQKALTVKLVKDGKSAMTLAIGDGANDVSMIQEAHCGIGIAGVEGAQASMSADYAIGQFRYLTKLLLVHGHWSYVRIADMHKVFFFKNIIWTFTMFWFQIYCDFNATYLYDYTYVLLFNLIFTSLPVIILGALDQDCNAKALLAFPSTYKRGIKGLDYTRTLFWLAVLDGIYQSVICFFVTYICWSFFPVVSSDGHSMDGIWIFGTTVGAGAVIGANLYAGLAMRYWTSIVWVVQIVSILSYFIWSLIYSAFDGTLYTDTAYWAMATVTFWCQILLIVTLSLLPRFFCKAWRTSFMPTNVDLVREAWIKGDLKQQLGLKEKPDATLTDVETGNDVVRAATRRSTATMGGGGAGGDMTASQSWDSTDTERQARNSKMWHDGRGTRMSYYDPDMLARMGPVESVDDGPAGPSARARSRTPEALGEEAFGEARRKSALLKQYQQQGQHDQQRRVTPIPQINIQRASGASSSFYPHGGHADSDDEDEDEYGEEHEEEMGPGTSRVALVDEDGNMRHEDRRGYRSQQQQQQQDHGHGQHGDGDDDDYDHMREVSDVSWHTADGEDRR